MKVVRRSGILHNQAFGQSISTMQSARVGKGGAIVVPAKRRERLGIEEGSIVIAEEKEDILIRPATVVPVKRHPPSIRQSSCYTTPSIRSITARREENSEKLGLDPDSTPHPPPP